MKKVNLSSQQIKNNNLFILLLQVSKQVQELLGKRCDLLKGFQ